MAKQKAQRPRQTNQLRIIGGEWRGRKLDFPDVEGLRPTPDRVRETLFNWLQPHIHGAHCLDLFFGSGALGLEALSRGARKVVMLDRDSHAITRLREHITRLQAHGAEPVHADALQCLEGTSAHGEFDIVFLDPPFRHNLLVTCCQLLEKNAWLTPRARIYLEAEGELILTGLPRSWRITHSKRAGDVGYYMAIRDIHPKIQGEQ